MFALRFPSTFAIGSLFVLSAVGVSQETPGRCWQAEKCDACYVAGMGASCGNWSCPHLIVTSEPYEHCVQADPGSPGNEHCTLSDEQASLCDMYLSACGPTPNSCVQTWVIHRTFYIPETPSGDTCQR